MPTIMAIPLEIIMCVHATCILHTYAWLYDTRIFVAAVVVSVRIFMLRFFVLDSIPGNVHTHIFLSNVHKMLC